MNSKRIALGIGIVLLVLAVLTPHAGAHRAYFVPQHSDATTGNTTTMDVYVEIDAGETLLSGQIQLKYDPTHAKVVENYLLCNYVDPTGPDQYCWEDFDANYVSERNGSMWGSFSGPQVSKQYDPPGPDPYGWYWVGTDDGLLHGPVTVPVETYVIEAYGTPGISPIDFGFAHFPEYCPACQKCKFNDENGMELDITWENGTFTHEGLGPSYTISGYTFDNNGDPENDATVKVINLNSSEKWDATTSPADNSYELTLDVGVDVDAGNILRLIAKDGVEWINVTDRPVTQAEIDAGGVSNVNLTLDEFYLDLKEFPMYEAEAPDYNEYCGPAVAKMWLDFHNPVERYAIRGYAGNEPG
jgi:hypothetical protein